MSEIDRISNVFIYLQGIIRGLGGNIVELGLDKVFEEIRKDFDELKVKLNE